MSAPTERLTSPDGRVATLPAPARPLRLAIVGSRSLDGHPGALRVIGAVLDTYQARHRVLVVVSGGAAGIDRMAAEEARRRGLEVVEHRPGGRSWRHYRARNLRIVADCDELVRIADPRSRSFGSGWTRDRAREAGRPTFEYTVTNRPLEPSGRAAGLLRRES
ncbi:MAG TPA: SLOG family protein [Candidatus Dormibacteraeota bacterium]|nr:SLOG family protein [Candidatus Dormibacteraeota bacterium]